MKKWKLVEYLMQILSPTVLINAIIAMLQISDYAKVMDSLIGKTFWSCPVTCNHKLYHNIILKMMILQGKMFWGGSQYLFL